MSKTTLIKAAAELRRLSEQLFLKACQEGDVVTEDVFPAYEAAVKVLNEIDQIQYQTVPALGRTQSEPEYEDGKKPEDVTDSGETEDNDGATGNAGVTAEEFDYAAFIPSQLGTYTEGSTRRYSAALKGFKTLYEAQSWAQITSASNHVEISVGQLISDGLTRIVQSWTKN